MNIGTRSFLLAGAAALVGLAYACTMRDITGVSVGEVSVSPPSANLVEGSTLRFTALAKDLLGNPIPVGAVTWSSDNPSLVSIASDGTAQGLQAGQTTIWANLEGVRGSATVTVAPGPTIGVNPASLSLRASFGGPSPDPSVLQITNAGGGTLAGLSASVEYPQGGATGWLTPSLSGTTAPTSLTVSALTGSLSAGTHTATIRVTAQGAKNSPLLIPVQVEITLDQPVIALSPTAVEFEVERDGPAPAPRTVQVTNAGGGTLSGLEALAPGGWLSGTLTSTTAPTQLLVQVNPAGLGIGSYSGTIIVRSSLAGVPIQELDVTLRVVTPPTANLGVTKTGPSAAFVGDTLLFLLTVTNAGPQEARNTVLVDSLPQGMAFVRASGGGAPSGSVVYWSLGTRPPATTRVDSLWALVEASGTLTNVARVSSTSTDPQPANNRATHSVVASAVTADLQVTKSGPSTAEFNDTISYVVTVRNNGPSAAESVVVMDSLPLGTSFLSATGGGTLDGTRVVWNRGTMAVGAQVVDTVRAVVESTGVLVNVAVARASTPDHVPGNNRATLTTSVSALADLSVTKTGPASAQSGDIVEYVITVSNSGPDPSGTVTVIDSLPPGMAFLSATGGGTLLSTGTVIWTLPGIASGATALLELRTRADVVGTVTNVVRAFAEAPDPDTTNNRAVHGTVVTGVDLSVAKSAVHDGTPAPGERITYRITLSRTGSITATGVVVTDTLPAGVTFVSASDGGVHDPAAGPNGVVTWNVGTFTATTESRTFELEVDIDPSATGTLTNIAAVTAATGDPNPANNRATSIIVLGASSDVGVEKEGPVTATPGTDLTYSLRVFNDGPSDATGISVTDTLPDGVTFVSASGGGSLDPLAGPNGVVSWGSIPTLENGADTTLTVVVRVPPGATGTLRNAAGVVSLTADPDPDNNRSVVTTTLVGSADLVVNKTGPGGGVPGAQITYTISVDNLGPSDAAGVVVMDSLPAEVTLVSADPAPSSQVGRVVTWNVGALPVASDPLSFSLTVQIGAGTSTPITNVARVGSTTADPDTVNNRSTFTTSVSGANVAVSKTVGAIVAGSEATYTVTVSNGGPSAAENVVVTDTLPEGVTFVSASNGGTYDAGAGPNGVATWPTIGTLANGANLDRTLTVAVASGRTANLVNKAAVTTTTTDTDLTNNVYTLSSPVETSADLAVTKTVTDSTGVAGRITAGSRAIYTLTVKNEGPSDAAGVVVGDTLPVGMTFVSTTPTGATVDGREVTWPGVASLPSGDSLVYILTVNTPPDASGDLENVATVTATTADPDPDNNSGTVSPGTVVVSADVSVDKDGPDAAVPGDTIAYTVTIENLGPSDASGIVVTDPIPAGVVFVSATGGGTYDEIENVVTWNVGDLAPSAAPEELTLTVAIGSSTTGTVTNRATVTSTSPDPNLGNNEGSQSTSVTGADLRVNKVAPSGASPGQQIQYTVEVQNLGPSTATGVVVTDTLPVGITFVSATGEAWSHNGGAGPNGVVTWNVGTLSTGAGAQSFTVTVVVNPTTSGPLVNIAAVTSTSPEDPNPANNRTTATTQVTSADLSVTKEASEPAVSGSDLTYTLTVDNAGPTDALGVVLTDTLPLGVGFVSASNGGTYDGSAGPNGVVTWIIGRFGTAASPLTRQIVVSIPSGQTGSLANVAAVASTTHDPLPGNNRFSLSTSLSASADLALAKTGDATATAGGSASYTITVTNNGPSDASGVVVTDVIPEGMSYQAATPPPASVDGQTVTWPTLATLASGASQEYALTLAVGSNTLGERTNSASATSDTSDPDVTNNTASHSTTVGPGPASKYLVTASESSLAAGSSVTITAQLADANDNPVATGEIVVTWGSTGEGGSFASPTSTTNANGVATVTFTTSTTAGTSHTVTATDGGGLTGTSPVISTVAGDAAIYVVTSSNWSPAAGSSVTITAQLADQYGNPTAGPRRTVTWSSTNGGSFNPTTSESDGNGTATTTFTTSVVAGTSHAVTATSGPPARTGTSEPITTVVGPPSPSQTTAVVPDGTAGVATSIVITVRDANNNKVSGAAGQLAGSVTEANTATLAPAVEQTADTTYTTSYTPANAGTDQVAISLNGEAISNSPYTSIVSPAELVSIAVTPADPSIASGQTQQFTATGTYTDASTADITTEVTWASSNTDVATIGESTGLATAVAAGTAEITATQGAISGGTTLTVTAAELVSIAVTPAEVVLDG